MPHSTPSLFRDPPPDSGTITAHCDGGARGNPGPAGFGAQITDSAGNVIAELSEFLGFRTNNYAEYSGLLASLDYALTHGHRSLRVISDSELMVKQIQGRYKVNSPDLKPLWQEAKNRISKLDRFEIVHALRHKNKDADRLANEAMDRGMKRSPAPTGGGLEGNLKLTGQPTPAPTSGSPAPASSGGGLRSLPPNPLSPTAAIPYPNRSTAPPPPRSFDPRGSSTAATPQSRQSEAPAASPKTPSPATMLRGFARDGVIHILGHHSLPDGTFVKIIPE